MLEDERYEEGVDLVAGEGGILDPGKKPPAMVDAVDRLQEEEVEGEIRCNPGGDGI